MASEVGVITSGGVFRERLSSAFDTMIERTQDFTDSAYTRHEDRERILLICDRLKLELNQLLRMAEEDQQGRPSCLVSKSYPSCIWPCKSAFGVSVSEPVLCVCPLLMPILNYLP